MTVSAQLIREFDLWQPGYGGNVVTIYRGATTSLAAIFTDPALTLPAANPQTLLSLAIGDDVFGKFALPLYTGDSYSLAIDGSDRTGVIQPGITSLKDEDATYATAKAATGSVARTLANHFDDVTHVLDQGVLTTSAADNATTITAAIGKVAALGGGEVLLPAGDIPFTQLTLPAGVRLRGRGRVATRLFSSIADKAITISGGRAGLRFLTLDGVSKQVGSVGFFSKNNDELFLDDVQVKNFETGLQFRAMKRASFLDLYVDNCTWNARYQGDDNLAEGGNSGLVYNNRWIGGAVTNSGTIGLDLAYVDQEVMSNLFEDVHFEGNASAVHLHGARFTRLVMCSWLTNTKNLDVEDDSATANSPRNYVQGLRLEGGSMSTGSIAIQQTAYDIVLASMDLKGVAFALTLPVNQVLLRDCIEDSAVTITGDGTKLIRQYTIQTGAADGTTTGTTPTAAWRTTLNPGETVVVTGRALFAGKNNTDRGGFVFAASAYRPGSTLAYKNQTVNFTVGQTLTGATSHATATIQADSDSGATGTLTLSVINGAFQANEVITDGAGGTAEVTSALVPQNVSIGAQNVLSTYTSTPSATAAFAGNGGDLELQVTGLSAKTLLWTAQCDIVRSA